MRIDVSQKQAVANPNFPGSVARAVLAIAEIAAKAVKVKPNPNAAKAAAEAAIAGTLVDVVQSLLKSQTASKAADALWALRSKTVAGIDSEYIALVKDQPDAKAGWKSMLADKRLMLTGQVQFKQVIACANSAARIAALAQREVSRKLVSYSPLVGCITGLANACRSLIPPQCGAAKIADVKAVELQAILANGNAQVANLASQTKLYAQKVVHIQDTLQAVPLAITTINSAIATVEEASKTFVQLAACYEKAAEAVVTPNPAMVAKAITLACANNPAAAVIGAIAGATSGNGQPDAATQALTAALETVGIKPTTEIAQLQTALSSSEPLFTVSYYRASAKKDVQDSLS